MTGDEEALGFIEFFLCGQAAPDAALGPPDFPMARFEVLFCNGRAGADDPFRFIESDFTLSRSGKDGIVGGREILHTFERWQPEKLLKEIY